MSRRAATVFAVVLLPLFLAACQEKKEVAQKPERPVLVQTVSLEPRVAERSFVATVRPRIESDLGFRVAGKVARRLVDVGAVVKAGQPLAELDSVDLGLQREQSAAEMRAARAALAQAEAEFTRTSSLIRDGWSTPSNLDRQRAAVEEARGRVIRAERAVSLAENALSYAVLTADADGAVTATMIEPGQVVSAGQPAVRLARTAEKEAQVAVPEALIGAVRESSARISLWSNPDRTYSGRLRELSPSADPTTRTYLARFTIDEAGPEVDLGMTATVTVGSAVQDRIVRLPLSALFNQGQGPAVWVVEADGKPALRPVSVAGYEARDVLIAGGLKQGDKVVTLGVQKIDPGQPVKIVQALQF